VTKLAAYPPKITHQRCAIDINFHTPSVLHTIPIDSDDDEEEERGRGGDAVEELQDHVQHHQHWMVTAQDGGLWGRHTCTTNKHCSKISQETLLHSVSHDLPPFMVRTKS
jgi:hypothetical protein